MNIHRINIDKLYLEKDSFIHQADARVKTISTILLIFSVVSLHNSYLCLAIFFVAIAILKKLGIKVKTLLYPSTVVATIFVIILFTYGGKNLIWQYSFLKITEESLSFAFLILFRVWACLAIFYIYMSTTKTNEIVAALSWLKVPETIVDLMLLMLRYVGTLSKEAERMYFSAKSRHAFSSDLPYFKKLKNFGMIAGALFLRSIDRADRVYIGMLSKGFKFKVSLKKLTKREIIQIVALIFISLSIVFVDRVMLC